MGDDCGPPPPNLRARLSNSRCPHTQIRQRELNILQRATADTHDAAVAADVAERLNDDEARREEDKWSAVTSIGRRLRCSKFLVLYLSCLAPPYLKSTIERASVRFPIAHSV